MKDTDKTITSTILIGLVTLPALYFLVFPLSNKIASLLINAFEVQEFTSLLIIDSILSFTFLCLFFIVMTKIKFIYYNHLIITLGILMFLFWGFESEFFYNGFHPQFPVIYEINMALNDIVAALVIVLVNNRITNRSS